jgi:hypothetical protein
VDERFFSSQATGVPSFSFDLLSISGRGAPSVSFVLGEGRVASHRFAAPAAPLPPSANLHSAPLDSSPLVAEADQLPP